MSIVVGIASEERGVTLTRENVFSRVEAPPGMRFAMLQLGRTGRPFWLRRHRSAAVTWLMRPGPCDDATLQVAPYGEDVYWGCDSSVLITRLSELYGAFELPDLSNTSDRALHDRAIIAQQLLSDQGLPVVVSLSHDLDLLLVAGPEPELKSAMSAFSK